MNTPTRPDPTGDTTETGMLGLWITPDGAIASVTVPADECARFHALRELMDGCLDVVRLRDDLDMWVNDEGLYQFEANPVASRVAGTFGFDWQPYHGPVLLLAGVDAHGDKRGLDRTSAALLAELAFASAHEGPLRPEEVDGHRARTYRDVIGPGYLR